MRTSAERVIGAEFTWSRSIEARVLVAILGLAATAEMLGCAEGTVKATTHQAIGRLRSLGLVEDEEVPVR